MEQVAENGNGGDGGEIKKVRNTSPKGLVFLYKKPPRRGGRLAVARLVVDREAFIGFGKFLQL